MSEPKQPMVPIYVALDYPNVEAARAFVTQVSPTECGLKVGSELYLQGGPALVREFVAAGFKVFLDLKFHDIPNTVAAAAREVTRLGVTMFTLHASGGARMIAAAMEATHMAAKQGGVPAPTVLAVTVLTSMDDAELKSTGVAADVHAQVHALAELALGAGATGLVCSALESAGLRARFGVSPVLVTPGIRLAGDAASDQSRVVTPRDAVRNGASALVIGRSITHSANPAATLRSINTDA
jgi:orotidine-5'-phosphate decarboxylase